jgi:predicted dehydrogenase
VKLRWGIAGLGRGRSMIKSLSEVAGCEVVAVCDANPRTLAQYDGLQTYTDYEQFIEQADVDVVGVITPGPEHAEQSILALEAGRHVLSETPCVYSIDEAQAVVDAVRRSGCKYMLAEDYIWMGWCQNLKQIAETGKLGEIVFAEAEYTHDCRGGMLVDSEGQRYHTSKWGSRDDLRPTWRATDLPPLFYCSHSLGPLLYLMEDRCTVATGLHTGARVAPEVCTVDMESGLLQTEAGRAIRLTSGFCIAHPFSLFVGLYGTRGSIRMVNLGQLQVKAWFEEDAQSDDWWDLPMEYQGRADGRPWVSVMLEEFAVSIVNDTEPPVDVYRSMEYTLPGICAHMSAEQGGLPVQVPDLRQN